ncbi:MAG TPA: hypothetical protein VMH81_35865 [Bryobacteraceae bacterium]|nr:hypothetical protein [Bryobacteraceae bacterium]
MYKRLLLVVALATTLAFAQGKGGRNNNMNSGMGGGMPAARPTRFDQFVEKLRLSKEQRDEVVSILKAAMEQSTDLRSKLEKDRIDLAGAMIESRTDDVKKILDDYTSLSAQYTDIEAKTFGKIYESLKPNQQAKAGQAFELLVAVLDRPGGGGGGRGRGRQ